MEKYSLGRKTGENIYLLERPGKISTGSRDMEKYLLVQKTQKKYSLTRETQKNISKLKRHGKIFIESKYMKKKLLVRKTWKNIYLLEM